MKHEVMLVELIDEHVYVVDLAGAQMGQFKTVIPWNDYGKINDAKWRQEWDFGTRARHWHAFLEKESDGPRGNAEKIELLTGQILLDEVKRWESKNKKTIGDVVTQAADQCDQDRSALLKEASAAIVDLCKAIGRIEIGTGIMWKPSYY